MVVIGILIIVGSVATGALWGYIIGKLIYRSSTVKVRWTTITEDLNPRLQAKIVGLINEKEP